VDKLESFSLGDFMKPKTPWTIEGLKAHYLKMGREIPESTIALLARPGFERFIKVDPLPVAPSKNLPSSSASTLKKEAVARLGKVGKKRQGVKVDPILNSLRSCKISASSSADHVALQFEGARLLTVNELFAILQFRKFQTFGYKKLWHQLVKKSVGLLVEKPFFTENVKLILYRRGKKLVDLDSVPVMFKYAIDALRKEGLIEDDNPTVVVSVEIIQEKGEPSVGIRLERVKRSQMDPGEAWTKWLSVSLDSALVAQ